MKVRDSETIALDYIKKSKHLADPFIKRLLRNAIDNASKEMSMRPTICVFTVVTHFMRPEIP